MFFACLSRLLIKCMQYIIAGDLVLCSSSNYLHCKAILSVKCYILWYICAYVKFVNAMIDNFYAITEQRSFVVQNNCDRKTRAVGIRSSTECYGIYVGRLDDYCTKFTADQNMGTKV